LFSILDATDVSMVSYGLTDYYPNIVFEQRPENYMQVAKLPMKQLICGTSQGRIQDLPRGRPWRARAYKFYGLRRSLQRSPRAESVA